MVGPCYRCLGEAEFREKIVADEYQDADPAADEELRTPYLEGDLLDLSAWARDAAACCSCHHSCAESRRHHPVPRSAPSATA